MKESMKTSEWIWTAVDRSLHLRTIVRFCTRPGSSLIGVPWKHFHCVLCRLQRVFLLWLCCELLQCVSVLWVFVHICTHQITNNFPQNSRSAKEVGRWCKGRTLAWTLMYPSSLRIFWISAAKANTHWSFLNL